MFDGQTFDPALDGARLSQQLQEVRAFMADKEWHSLAEISHYLGYPEASVSARLRDLRKSKFGSWTIDRRRQPGSNQYAYRMTREQP